MAERNVYTTTRSTWTGSVTYRCAACGMKSSSEHRVAFHECDTLLLGSIGNTPSKCPWDDWKPSKDLS